MPSKRSWSLCWGSGRRREPVHSPAARDTGEWNSGGNGVPISWKEIDPVHFQIKPGLQYEVSDQGSIRRRLPNGKYKYHVVRQPFRGYPYLRVALYTVNGHKKHTIHGLVAHHFIGPRPPDMTVNHKDGNRLNNQALNLEYLTQADNNRHAAELGRSKGARSGWNTTPGQRERLRGTEINTAKLNEDKVREIRSLFGDLSAIELGRKYGVSRDAIYGVVTRESWSHVA